MYIFAEQTDKKIKVNKSKMNWFENVYFIFKKKLKIWIIRTKLILFLQKKYKMIFLKEVLKKMCEVYTVKVV